MEKDKEWPAPGAAIAEAVTVQRDLEAFHSCPSSPAAVPRAAGPGLMAIDRWARPREVSNSHGVAIVTRCNRL